MTSDIGDFAGIGRIVDADLTKQVYTDGLQEGTSELGQMLGELSKTTRMVVQPLLTLFQGGSARLNDWAAEAFEKVPSDRLVKPKPHLLAGAFQAIAMQDDESQLRENYIQLLASMMDSEYQDKVHPSFPSLLQTLTPLEANLLQITPYGEVSLPDGLEKPQYRFKSGLLATWESWKEPPPGGGRYRFFIKVDRLDDDVIGKSSYSSSKNRHFGFLEFPLPQSLLFKDRGIAFENLCRIGLIKKFDRTTPSGSVKEHFERDDLAKSHLNNLLIGADKFGVCGEMYFRTDLGKAFARSCCPPFTGTQIWRPVTQLSETYS